MTTEQSREEYKALRATIRERGTWRVVLFWLTMAVWSALLLTAARGDGPFSALVSLVALAAGFEAVYALHVGVERIGRYLQVFYEEAGAVPGWEHTAMAYGREPSGDGLDPLFSKLFVLAAMLNLVPIALSRRFGLIAVATIAHALFVVRLMRARSYAATQRDNDLEKFRKLREKVGSGQ